MTDTELADRLVLVSADQPVETYPAWLARQRPEDQDRALGADRAARFRAGELDVTRYTDPPLPDLTLDELAADAGIDPFTTQGEPR